jgi:hypothetical protein
MSYRAKGNGSAKFYINGGCPDSENIIGEKMKRSTTGSYLKKLQTKWWLITTIVVIAGAGFYASQHLTGIYIQKDDYQNHRNEHKQNHEKIDSKFTEFNKMLTGVRIDQARESERTKLIDARIELLLSRIENQDEVSRPQRDIINRDEFKLKQAIIIQEERIKRIENDPRIKRVLSDDPLDDLNF